MSRFSLLNFKERDSIQSSNQGIKRISLLEIDSSLNRRETEESKDPQSKSELMSPRSLISSSKSEKTLEETLKSTRYFKKPDIIPSPSRNYNDYPDTVDWENKYKDLLKSFEKQKLEKHELEIDNERLQFKVRSLL